MRSLKIAIVIFMAVLSFQASAETSCADIPTEAGWVELSMYRAHDRIKSAQSLEEYKAYTADYERLKNRYHQLIELMFGRGGCLRK